MFEFASAAVDDREQPVREISTRIERIRSLAANSDIGGEAEGHQISHECKQILSSISTLG